MTLIRMKVLNWSRKQANLADCSKKRGKREGGVVKEFMTIDRNRHFDGGGGGGLGVPPLSETCSEDRVWRSKEIFEDGELGHEEVVTN